ncbi:MAG: DUF4129 domain-containing protein [Bacteroidetes bacterium]|nr:MAG: DUF4129 domain-containing protein [Bacteroidota bacterium]
MSQPVPYRLAWIGLLLLMLPVLLPGQTAPDRRFDPEALEAYRADPDYAYGLEPLPEAPEPPPRLGAGWLAVWKVFMYVVVGGVLILLLYMILSRTILRPARRVAGPSELPGLKVEDLQDLPYDRLVQEAEVAGDYRRAVRLRFLQTLKRLDAIDLIAWRDNKTNQDYYYELYDSPLRHDFEALSRIYDYVWYGHFDLPAERYPLLRTRFEAFQSRLNAYETA